MMSDQSKTPKKQEREADYTWNPEQMLDTIMKGQETIENNWTKKGLQKLTNEILDNFKEYGGINHLGGRDLP